LPTQRIIASGDVRRGYDTKLVVARDRWFESIFLQRRVSDEPMSGLWHPDRRDLLALVVSAVADG
jgi:hypothetical protein